MTKRKRKVAYPTDRDGTPINVGDWLMFDDGPFHVATLTYYGEDLKAIGCWTAEDEDENFCDNLRAGRIIAGGRGKGKR